MKKLIFILIFLHSFAVLAQDTLYLEFKSKNPKNPIRNLPLTKLNGHQTLNLDTTKSRIVDLYIYSDNPLPAGLSLVFVHSDSSKIREASFEELKKIEVLNGKKFDKILEKISENGRAAEKVEKYKEKLEQEKLRKKMEKMSLWERMTIPEICIMSSDFRAKEKDYIQSCYLFLVVEDTKKQKAKIIPVRYLRHN